MVPACKIEFLKRVPGTSYHGRLALETAGDIQPLPGEPADMRLPAVPIWRTSIGAPFSRAYPENKHWRAFPGTPVNQRQFQRDIELVARSTMPSAISAPKRLEKRSTKVCLTV